MRITFLGGADEVGASSTLIEIAGKRLLVDAGIRPSPKSRWGLAGDQLPDLARIDQAGGVDAILVSHAHTDHTGALELVVGRYPHAPVYATPATIALSRVLHQDARRIMASRLEEEGELPLFDDVAVEKLMSAFVPLDFRARLPLGEGLVVTFYPAGHIAGAAMIYLESDEGRVLVSGDLSITPQRTVDGLKPPPVVPDVLILESTYGGRLHANRSVEERRLAATVGEVVADDGKVLIPAFALGRAQELLLILSEFQQRGQLPAAPVWADGMVRAICQAYAGFPEILPLPLRERIEAGGPGSGPFYTAHIHPIQNPAQRQELIWGAGPAVIVSSSGMLSGGPSQQYARALASGAQHAILLTGYQDEEAPGRRLQEIAARGGGTLRLGKDKVNVQCRLGTYSLSAHADEGQLISLVEALDPGVVLLVHGDEAARASLEAALEPRGRSVRLPHAGGAFEFDFHAPPALSPASAPHHGVLEGKMETGPIDLAALWQSVGGGNGGYFTLNELARAGWGDERRAAELEQALAGEPLYFTLDPYHPGVYRARTRSQVELALQRRQQLSAYPGLAGQLLVLRDLEGTPRPARCTRLAGDRFFVEGEASPQWPEAILALLGPAEALPALQGIEALAEQIADSVPLTDLLTPGLPRPLDEIFTDFSTLPDLGEGPGARDTIRAALALALLRAGAENTPTGYLLKPSLSRSEMEPNEALAYVRSQFPPEAGLRRCGYHLDRHTITLAFDFPEAAFSQFGGQLAGIETATGWSLEVDPEANQAALNTLARQVFPQDWQVVKGPAIHRTEKQVALSVRPPAAQAGLASQHDPTIRAARQQFEQASGWQLHVTLVAALTQPPAAISQAASSPASLGTPLEINAAYALIKRDLAGSTLYRTSLKDGEIVLSFISPQVGQRYWDQIQDLSQRTGWPLSLNPTPNQGAILEAARALLAQAGLEILKGPGIHVERGEVTASLAELPAEAEQAEMAQAFTAQTGYQLILQGATPKPASAPAPPDQATWVEIVVERVRLSNYQQGLPLDPEKLRKTIQRVQRMGRVSPPIRVRRLADGYRLMDGLYRLRAAEALGLEHIPAEIE